MVHIRKIVPMNVPHDFSHVVKDKSESLLFDLPRESGLSYAHEKVDFSIVLMKTALRGLGIRENRWEPKLLARYYEALIRSLK